MSEFRYSEPKRVVTKAICNKCQTVVTGRQLGKHYSCKKCDCWVTDVTIEQKPYSIFADNVS